MARAFCGRLLSKYPQHTQYFDPALDWPQPIEHHATFPIILEQLAVLGDTRSRRELLVFAQANPSRLPLAMGIRQPNIPVRRMASERKAKVNDALVRILCRLLTPVTVSLEGRYDWYLRDNVLALAGQGDGHILTVTIALLLAILTGDQTCASQGYLVLGKPVRLLSCLLR